MKKLRLIALGTGVIAVAGGVVLAACSSDDTIVNPLDSGFDAPIDAPGRDTGTDTGADTGTDAGLDADADAGYNATTFPRVLATAICRSVSNCCFGNANLQQDAAVDGGFFDQAACVAHYESIGVRGSLAGIGALDAGSLVINQQKAQDCLNGAAALGCSIQGSAFASLRSVCFEGIQGTAAVGLPCVNSASCAPGGFCNPDAGGGAKCEAVRDAGAWCGDQGETRKDEPCSWRGQGGDQFCQFYADFWNDIQLDAGSWYCQAANGDGGDCISDRWCKAGVCDNNAAYQCRSPGTFFFATECPGYVKP